MRIIKTAARARQGAAVDTVVEEPSTNPPVNLPSSLFSDSEGGSVEGNDLREHIPDSQLLPVDQDLDLLDSAENRHNVPDTATSYRNPAFGLSTTPEVKVAKTPAHLLSATQPRVRFSEVKVSHTPAGKVSKSRKSAVELTRGSRQAKVRSVSAPLPPDPSSSSNSSEEGSASSGSEVDSEEGLLVDGVLPIPQAADNPFPRGPRSSAVPKLFTPVNSKEFEQITEHSFYQQFEAEVLISVLSYLHDWQAWSASTARLVKHRNQELFQYIDRSFAHVSSVVDLVEDRYAELVLRATSKGDLGKGAVEAWSVQRRGLANGLYLPDRCQKVLKRIHDKQVSSLVSRAGKASSKDKDSVGSKKKKKPQKPAAGGHYKAQSSSDVEDGPSKQTSNGAFGQFTAKGKRRGAGGGSKKQVAS